MKRFFPLLIIVILVVSLLAVTTAFAGVSISGSSSVLAGKTYTYTIKVTGNASSIGGTVTCSGVFSGSKATFWKDSSSGMNQNLTATTTITVKVASGASPGEKGTIKVSGEGSTFDGEKVGSFGISGSKTCTVVEKAPTPTKDPNATPRPPEGWEIVEISVDESEEGVVVEVDMEDDYEIPEDLLNQIAKRGNTLVVNFGTYKCTIDPKALTDFEGIKKLNLLLDFEKAAGLTEIAGGKDAYQLHFGHSGQLPGKLTFTFEATENEPGDTVYLYYYYGEANIIEGKMKAVVDENGMVTFDIYHCSSYFVTSEVLENAQSNFDTEAAAQIVELNTQLEEKQTEIDGLNAQIQTLTTEKTALQTDLTATEQEVSDLEDDAVAADAEIEAMEEKSQEEFSLVVLLAAVAAAVLLAILLTMLFTRAGLFRKSEEEIAAKQERKEEKQQAKADAETAKQAALEAKQQAKADAEAAKQAALEAKQQAKLEAKEAKQQAKLDAKEAKQQAKDAGEQAAEDAEEAVAQASEQAEEVARAAEEDIEKL